ncbi:hypothetical protein [Corynebacterium sp. 13CS0277]|nr:hypothetical protein [Corynebacterium sp. 13CS0277]
MDLSVVKTVLGDFGTFVANFVALVKNVPAAIGQLAGLERFSS